MASEMQTLRDVMQMYGKCDAKLFSFNKKLPIVNPKTGKKLAQVVPLILTPALSLVRRTLMIYRSRGLSSQDPQ